MYATIRTYGDAPELADQLLANSSAVEELISSVPGFHGYFIVKTDSGCATISVFDDASGAEESSRRAKAWLAERTGEISAPPPVIWQGEVVLQVGALARA